jgi:hypothetical protein
MKFQIQIWKEQEKWIDFKTINENTINVWKDVVKEVLI